MNKAEEKERKKAFLRSYRKRKNRIAALKDQEEILLAMKTGASCGTGDGMPHAHNRTDLSDYMVRMDDVLDKISMERGELEKEVALIVTAVNELKNSNETYVLTKRYMMGWDWDQIAESMGYATRSVHYIHSNALKYLVVPQEWQPEQQENQHQGN